MMENTTVLDCVLSKFYTERKELHLVSIYLKKAFVFIAHDAHLRSPHLRPKLEVLTKAPLKPQERLFFLRCHLLRGVFHLLALWRATVSSLNKADTEVRSYLGKWLDLPVDSAVPYFHANISEGCLDVPCLRWSGLRLRLDRLRTFSSPHVLVSRGADVTQFLLSHTKVFNFNSSDFTDPAVQVPDSFITNERSKVEKFLFLDGVFYNTKDLQRQMRAQRLYASMDGVAPTLPSAALSPACPATVVTPVLRCDVCARDIKTKIGLGVHNRRVHAVEADNAQTTIGDLALITTGTSASSQTTASHSYPSEIRPIPIVSFRGPYKSEVQELDELTWAILCRLPPSDGIFYSGQYLKLNKDSPRTTLEFYDGRSPLYLPSVGVRQGYPLSPLLFNMALDEYLRCLSDTIGVPFRGHQLNSVVFADDTFLFASITRGMQKLIFQMCP
ncbi:Retrovirus-related Pol polyprotein from type-2 retrotransposable element R2DM [Araneus ventricosus]|uniref:Retrovirus-related Pol polyprotein from type-2 retrotransposable element R2DM n=1 Tax=Araneus ventricosus TaxID=182803 RepID=A0A4Y2LRB7_ARAVE|nr:Retrovirus-related Pol polyprotein from type-2 retrotransposable element R2DM [Araneus ventricosus]